MTTIDQEFIKGLKLLKGSMSFSQMQTRKGIVSKLTLILGSDSEPLGHRTTVLGSSVRIENFFSAILMPTKPLWQCVGKSD